MEKIIVNKIENTLLIKFLDTKIEFSTTSKLRSKLFELAQKGNQRFIIDLTNIDRIDSSGIGVFIAFWKMFGNDARIVFCHLQPHIKNVFNAASLLKIFPIAIDEQEAIGMLASHV
ncbi:STAS domain-containing protein [candidate division KSB1 bacterium]|nr:STAS domain-containing protein [candidate division KSB1 bacterium]